MKCDHLIWSDDRSDHKNIGSLNPERKTEYLPILILKHDMLDSQLKECTPISTTGLFIQPENFFDIIIGNGF